MVGKSLHDDFGDFLAVPLFTLIPREIDSHSYSLQVHNHHANHFMGRIPVGSRSQAPWVWERGVTLGPQGDLGREEGQLGLV